MKSEFDRGAQSMKLAMLAAYDAHVQNIELGFPPELVLDKMREHMELITANMVVSENIGENSG